MNVAQLRLLAARNAQASKARSLRQIRSLSAPAAKKPEDSFAVFYARNRPTMTFPGSSGKTVQLRDFPDTAHDELIERFGATGAGAGATASASTSTSTSTADETASSDATTDDDVVVLDDSEVSTGDGVIEDAGETDVGTVIPTEKHYGKWLLLGVGIVAGYLILRSR